MSTLKTILIIALVVIAGLSVCLFLGYMGIEPFTVFWTITGDFIRSLNFDFSNPSTLITTGAGAVTAAVAVGGPLLSKLNSTKDQVTALKQSAETQISGLSSELKTAKDSLGGATSSLTDANGKITDLSKQVEDLTKQAQVATDLKTQLSTVQSNFGKLESEKNSIKMQYDDLQKLYAKATAQLEVLTPKVK